MKKYIIPVAAFIAGMAIVPSTFAVDNNAPTTYEYAGWAGLVDCLSNKENVTCALKNDMTLGTSEAANLATVSKNVTLDLRGKTLTIGNNFEKDGLTVVDGGTLTITNGHIVNNGSNHLAVNVTEGGSLVLNNNADIKGYGPIVATDAVSVVVNGKIEGAENATAVAVKTTDTETVVEINGEVTAKGTGIAYKQEGDVAATIKSKKMTAVSGVAANIKGGSLVVTGAKISSDDSAIEFAGEISTVAINGCSEITAKNGGAALWLDKNTEMSNLTIANSTLKSAKGYTIAADSSADATVTTVKISGSKLLAGTDKEVKHGDIEFGSAEYDGATVAEGVNVLSAAKGHFGVENVVCDATAADEGEDKGEEAENPNTADTIATYMTIAAVALLGLGATAFVAKKSNR